jgi:hypothetical protein
MAKRNQHEDVGALPKTTRRAARPCRVFGKEVTPMPIGTTYRAAKAPFRKRTKLWIAVFAVLVLGVIGYGI